ncbi:hypothetical protein PQC48_gp106 [Escherichia phage MN05]|uniref:Uncharacterized protein n=1 Tax=Escherichia phage MN05 TaxID=2711185 RepID=A0A858I7B7_9CAUD|nr:hypothetical protein PQC48_gp106 [Escherichia phage MN05]QIN96184.1 hypothetical protein MN05_00120 [Escherichia phage MN05]
MNQESILPINWAPYSNDVAATRKTNHIFKERAAHITPLDSQLTYDYSGAWYPSAYV